MIPVDSASGLSDPARNLRARIFDAKMEGTPLEDRSSARQSWRKEMILGVPASIMREW